MAKGQYATEERKNRLKVIEATLRQQRQKGNDTIDQNKFYANLADQLGVTEGKFKEYMSIMEGKGLIMSDQVEGKKVYYLTDKLLE